MSSRKPIVILGIIFIVSMVGGMALCIAGGASVVSSRIYLLYVLIGVGMAVIFLGMMIFMIGCCVIQARVSSRMRQAIADESSKYSTRSPTPCSWRLDSTRIYSGGYGNRRTTVTYRVSDLF